MPIKLFQNGGIVLQEDNEDFTPEAYPIYEAVGVGWTLMGVAMTSMPHLRQRDHEIEMVGDEVKVPVYKLGIYWHPFAPNGQLVFDEAATEQMIENYDRKVTDYNVSLNKSHTDDEGALAFLDKQDGGRIELEDNWLVLYGPPVDDDAIATINSKKWRYASGEFALDYTSNLLFEFMRKHPHQTIPFDLSNVAKPPRIYLRDAVGFEPVAKKIWSAAMTKRTIKIGDLALEVTDDGKITLTEGQVQTIVSQITHDEKSIADLTEKVGELELKVKNSSKDEFDGWPEEAKQVVITMREEAQRSRKLQLQQLEQTRLENIALAISTAESRIDNGRKLAPIIIELCKAGMTLSGYEPADGVKVVKLSDTNDAVAMQRYHDGIYRLILQLAPGQVPVTSPEDDIHLESHISNNGVRTYTDDEYKAALEKYKSQRLGSEAE